jgi:hypothetical protein
MDMEGSWRDKAKQAVSNLCDRLAQDTRRIMQPTLDELFKVLGGVNNLPPRTHYVTPGGVREGSYMSPTELLGLGKTVLTIYGMTPEEAKFRQERNSAEKFYYANQYGLRRDDSQVQHKVAILRALESSYVGGDPFLGGY